MRISLIQPAMPTYRYPLFARMAATLGAQFTVYSSSDAALGVLQTSNSNDVWQRELGPIRRFLPGVEWQSGAIGIKVARGDIVILCGAPRNISTLLLLAKCKFRGAKTIWWGQYWSSTSKAWRARLRFALMRLPDAILFYTEQEMAEYRKHDQGNSKKLFGALNNGIDTAVIKKLRAPFVPADRPKDLLFLGRITAKAELGLLLEALSKPVCAGLLLEVIGSGPELAQLKLHASKLGISERITWRPATTNEEIIAESANRCKAFVYPGAVGLSLIHGLTYGLPAIIHDNRWQHMPEVAAHRHGVNGLIFSQGDADALAAALAKLLAEPARLKEMSAQATATTQDTFNIEDMAQRFVTFIDRLK